VARAAADSSPRLAEKGGTQEVASVLARLIRRGDRGENGFTLIELMIVILVILILAAILVPQFSLARERARKASCVSNQRNIETAVAMWSTDNILATFTGGQMSGSYPGYTAVTGVLGGPQYAVPRAFICPDDGVNNSGQDYYLSNGSPTGAAAAANPAAPSYSHVTCTYAANVNPTGCTPGDPWVNCYNGGGSGAGLNHERGGNASP
jgi:prepilin-type N-terminal cleavage/methylation domain-containing protein